MSKRTALGSWAFSIGPYEANPIDFLTVCRTVQALGFDGVELGAFPPHPNPGNPDGSDDRWPGALPEKSQRHELRAILGELDLGISCLGANLWSQKLINTDDQGPYVAEFRKNSEFALDLGIQGVRVDTVQAPTIHRLIDYATAMDRVVRAWKTCCDIAADKGQYVTWEVEPGFAFNKPSDAVRIHDAVDKANFGIQYDTCHGQMVSVVGARQEGTKETYPTQIDYIRLLSGRINHIHLIDSDNTCHKNSKGEDETSAHPPFGRGILDFDCIMPELVKASRLPHDWWTIDLCFWADAWEAVPHCKAVLDELIRKYG